MVRDPAMAPIPSLPQRGVRGNSLARYGARVMADREATASPARRMKHWYAYGTRTAEFKPEFGIDDMLREWSNGVHTLCPCGTLFSRGLRALPMHRREGTSLRSQCQAAASWNAKRIREHA